VKRSAFKGLSVIGLLLPVWFVFAVACNGDEDGAPRTIIGTWDMVSIDGDPLPVDVSSSGVDTTRVLAGTLTFEAGGAAEMMDSLYIRSDGVPLTTAIRFPGEWEPYEGDILIYFDIEESARFEHEGSFITSQGRVWRRRSNG
jgi:hypothetical protein